MKPFLPGEPSLHSERGRKKPDDSRWEDWSGFYPPPSRSYTPPPPHQAPARLRRSASPHALCSVRILYASTAAPSLLQSRAHFHADEASSGPPLQSSGSAAIFQHGGTHKQSRSSPGEWMVLYLSLPLMLQPPVLKMVPASAPFPAAWWLAMNLGASSLFQNASQ